MIQLSFTDITKRKHKGSKSSIKANPKREAKAKMRNAVLEALRHNNLTGKQIAELLQVPFNAISGRFSELKALRLIGGTGERFEGSEILRLRRGV